MPVAAADVSTVSVIRNDVRLTWFGMLGLWGLPWGAGLRRL